MKTLPSRALLVVDMQRDFLAQEGRMQVGGVDVDRLIESANSSIAAALEAHEEVIYILTEFSRRDWANVFRRFAAVEGSDGCDLDPRLSQRGQRRFMKASGNAFSNPELDRFLRSRNIRELRICGVYADACVAATVKGARKLGYTVSIVGDAVATSSRRKLLRALKKYRSAGIAVV